MSETPPLISRRTFLATGAVLAAGAAIPSTLLVNTTDTLEVTERTLSLAGLPAAFEGYRIAQVSDVHLYEGAYHPAAFRALGALRAAKADLIVVTGDMWDSVDGCLVTHEW
ncbi:MAG: twin-arginine translocation signal domain-containing protein, partial [Gemmatimonadaceae bacterium]